MGDRLRPEWVIGFAGIRIGVGRDSLNRLMSYSNDDQLGAVAKLELYEQVERLQKMMVDVATGTPIADQNAAVFSSLRKKILDQPGLKHSAPDFLGTCRDLSQFWAHISEHSTYAERRRYLWDAFRPLLDAAEKHLRPCDEIISEKLVSLSVDEVSRIWESAISRRADDPEGAITLARTLLESVLKFSMTYKLSTIINQHLCRFTNPPRAT